MNKIKKGMSRLLGILITIVLCLGISCSAFAAADAGGAAFTDEQQQALDLLQGQTAGVMTGTPQDKIIQSAIKDTELQYFNNVTDLIIALKAGKVNFMVLSEVNYFTMAQQYPELGYLKVPLTYFDIGTIFPKTEKGASVCAQLNEYIAKLTETGELEQLQNKWLFELNYEDIDIPATGENGVLNMATSNTLAPYSFDLNGKNAGFDIAIIAGFCREYGYGLKIDNVDFAGVISGIAAGKYDLGAGQIAWTAERAENVLYSDFYYTQSIVPIVVADNYNTPVMCTADGAAVQAAGDNGTAAAAAGTAENTLLRSIRRSLIDEDRWVAVLHGLLVTLTITAAGFVLANVLGAVLCAMAMSRSKALHILAGVYNGLFQGLPVVVILMMLYYIVFAHSDISNTTVAYIGFGLIFAANMAQLFESGITGIDKGQWEAALAMGMTKRQTFTGIVLPQVVRRVLPAYFSNLINLLKGTSVVGYIATADLTKVGDIIRSNTYEAFVPLLVVALLYLLITCILLLVMKLIQKKLAPRRVNKATAVKADKGGQKV